MAEIISGKVLAAAIKQRVAAETAQLKQQGITPKLTVIIVGENPASQTYVAGKAKDCAECGIHSDVIRLPESSTEEELLRQVCGCNKDPAVHGLLVQLPLPKHICEKNIINAICPEKDVDGFTPVNVGRMVIGEDCFLPCTPAGCMEMLKSTGVPLAGKRAVVIGRSNIVGKPAALLLCAANATVTICHSRTQNLKELCAEADILVAAIGKAKFVAADMVKEGAIVIDVGINRGADGKLCGDVDFDAVSKKASYLTPVPGGVGLMTRAMLMQNTLKAAKQQCAQGQAH
ncbi:MAG: bifunctional methylenetetrahydrofolate dehydrogenase/methenyltetrahydrofolate cyclohydrolase FolD [Ruthenibacterium sp.]